jgi:hypothetical protein
MQENPGAQHLCFGFASPHWVILTKYLGFLPLFLPCKQSKPFLEDLI